jgi:hypothetical protein
MRVGEDHRIPPGQHPEPPRQGHCRKTSGSFSIGTIPSHFAVKVAETRFSSQLEFRGRHCSRSRPGSPSFIRRDKAREISGKRSTSSPLAASFIVRKYSPHQRRPAQLPHRPIRQIQQPITKIGNVIRQLLLNLFRQIQQRSETHAATGKPSTGPNPSGAQKNNKAAAPSLSRLR